MKILVIGYDHYVSHDTVLTFAELGHDVKFHDIKKITTPKYTIKNKFDVVFCTAEQYYFPIKLKTSALIVTWKCEPSAPAIINADLVLTTMPNCAAFYSTFYPDRMPKFIEVTAPILRKHGAPKQKRKKGSVFPRMKRPENKRFYNYTQSQIKRERDLQGSKSIIVGPCSTEEYFKYLCEYTHTTITFNTWGTISSRIFDAINHGSIPNLINPSEDTKTVLRMIGFDYHEYTPIKAAERIISIITNLEGI